jgi:hypothetical protein
MEDDKVIRALAALAQEHRLAAFRLQVQAALVRRGGLSGEQRGHN